MKQHVRQARTPLNLSPSSQERLTAYVLAAGAAGVGVMALSTPSQAEVVYTPAYMMVHPNQFHVGLALDLNGDGVTDFELINYIRGTYGRELVAPAARGNQVVGSGSYASALVPGVTIGSGGPFAHRARGTLMGVWNDQSGIFSSNGPWKNTRNRYLGFKFLINGEYHFGWARMTIDLDHMLLTGYAYETVAGKAIIAALESGAHDAASIVPKDRSTPALANASLGRLAQGAASLIAWRRTAA